jgi:hypothetical protein
MGEDNDEDFNKKIEVRTCLLTILLLALNALCANLFCILLLSPLFNPSAAAALFAFSSGSRRLRS